jgi:hypothetical protein
MRVLSRTPLPWLLLSLAVSGCIDRSRLNPDCSWTGDLAVPLDLAQASDRRHLTDDAQLAEGIAVRTADTQHKRRFGYVGHGGLIEHGRVVRECMATLAAAIERNHGVTAAQIDAARAQRNPWFDAPVILSFAAAYALAATFATGWVRRRFVDASRLVVGAVIVGSALAFSALGVQLAVVWSAIWECVRIGDDHFGTFRAARPPWGDHVDLLFAAGVALFVIVSALPRRGAVGGVDAPSSPVTTLFTV